MTEVNPTPSPCINVCKIDERTGWCEGCWRTRDEIAVWSSASEAEKQAIWQKIHQRIQPQYQNDLSAFDPD